MAQARKFDTGIETLATTGTVVPNSRDKRKVLVMTGNVTIDPMTDVYPGDTYYFRVTLGGNTLTLHADYVSLKTTPPTILENSIIQVDVLADGTFEYFDLVNAA